MKMDQAIVDKGFYHHYPSDDKNNSRRGVGEIEIEPWPEKKKFASNRIYDVDEDDNNSCTENQFSKSEIHCMYHTYPFGFRTPENCSSTASRWIYPITFGGGLVGGDRIEAKFVIGQRCCVVVCTQEMTKVYHCLHSNETTQAMDFSLKEGCLLCVLPDPLVCYKDANFHQKQTFHLAPSSNLVFLDWLLAGRTARGESWQFDRYRSNIEIYFADKLVFRECNELENTPQVALSTSMKQFQVMGTCIVLGPYLTAMANGLEEKYGSKQGFGERHSQSLVVSVSPLVYSVGEKLQLTGCYIRFLATDIKQASVVIEDITRPLLQDLGADPFQHKL